MTPPVIPPIRATFRAVTETVVPEAASLSPEGWSALEGAVEQALAQRPEGMRRQFAMFVRAIEYLPLATSRGRFSRLDPQERQRFLRKLEVSPVLLVRRGFWGLRTLALLGYYTQPEVQEAIGYRAHPDGWSARRRSGQQPAIPDPSAS